nr:tRNA epoxyqueuosine(34) reductase QueG [Petrachloros mirabilis]
MSLTAETVKHQALAVGFHKVGIAAVHPDPPVAEQADAEKLQRWLAQGYQANMAWMQDPRRQNIRQVMPNVRSVICVGLNYYTSVERPEKIGGAKISRYGWGRDYHKVLTRRLKRLVTWLEAQGEEIQARFYVDTGPIQEKAWAQRAGLGWIGKHSNVITRDYGSWIFLGEVLTNLALAPDQPHLEHCGTCRRCLDACPTAAITEPFVVDANRCIAYHTIENRAELLPPELAARLEGWVAGCDICQDVCPWNQRFAQETDVVDFQPYAWNVAPTLTELAQISEAERDRRFRASALRRIQPRMLRRNAQANLEAQQSKSLPPQALRPERPSRDQEHDHSSQGQKALNDIANQGGDNDGNGSFEGNA